jgi:hypothetical protein
LTLSEQYEIISKHGNYLGVRSYYNYFINLYLLEDKFFELWFFRPNNEIEKIEELTDLKKLDLYIVHMQKLNCHENS